MGENSNSMLDKVSNADKNFSIEIRCKIFFLVDQESADLYAELLTEIRNFEHFNIISDEFNWGTEAEMTRVVLYEVKNKVRRDEQ